MDAFRDLPQAVGATTNWPTGSIYTMADVRYRFPDIRAGGGDEAFLPQRKSWRSAARERYRPFHDAEPPRAAGRELDLIEKLDLAGYFLIVWDIVNYCRASRASSCRDAVGREQRCVTAWGSRRWIRSRWICCSSASCRRSAANGRTSISICRAAIAASRSFSTSTRATAQLGAAMTANVITYRGRSAAREVGKVLGLDADEVDRLAKVMHHFEWRDPNESFERNLRTVGIDPNATIGHFAELWARIQRLPRHLGQHSGGMVIRQGRLDEVVPLENASMPGRVVIQWDKEDCTDMGM